MSVEVRGIGADPALGRAFTIAAGDYRIELVEYGARLQRCFVPDAAGKLADVVPGHTAPADYVDRGGSMGAVCGRYGNRIGFARLELLGETYALTANNPPHSLHGGLNHFGRHVWRGEVVDDQTVRMRHFSPHLDEGWPGNLGMEVVYRLTDDGELAITMSAQTDRPTFVNLIHHGYWNLAGHDSGTIDAHLLRVEADHYLPKSEVNLPTGELADVTGTPFDFRQYAPVGRHVDRLPGNGYDHNLCVDINAGAPQLHLVDPASGRALWLRTNQPGIQLFTANNWVDVAAKDGAIYQARAGIAFETQVYPNTPNTPAFNPRPLLPGEHYRHEMVVKFDALGRGEVAALVEAARG